MYRIKAINDDEEIIIHNSYSNGTSQKLKNGSIVQGINTIDSFSFSIYSNNPAFYKLHEYKTEIEVFDLKKHRYEFQGRVLKPKKFMDNNGLIYKEIMCESYLGYLCDSEQQYVEEKNWKLKDFLQYIINIHNSIVESYKQFKLGTITVTDPNDNIYLGIQRDSTWKTINDKLLNKLGGEIIVRKENDGLYLDYLVSIGENKDTAIELKKNMMSISQEVDLSSFVTRIIPLGAKIKIKDSSGNDIDSEQRIGIESVNNNVPYIDDDLAISKYGIIAKHIYFDDVTEPSNLKRKAEEYRESNNKVIGKFTIDTLDLSLLGLTIDNFRVGNYHTVKNNLLNIEETLRIIKKTININDPKMSSLEFGESYKKLSDFQLNSTNNISQITSTINKINNDYVSNKNVETIVSSSIKKEGIISKNTIYENNNGFVIASNTNNIVSLSDIPSISDFLGKEIRLLIASNEENYKYFSFNLSSTLQIIEYSSLNSNETLCKTIISLSIEENEWLFNILGSFLIQSDGTMSLNTEKPEIKLYKVDILS